MKYNIMDDNHTQPIMRKTEKYIAISLCITFLLLHFYRIFVEFEISPDSISYTGFDIPDYMINYQGGFVRRGLLGEILLQVFNVVPYSLYHAVFFIECVAFGVLAYFLYRMFKETKWIPIVPSMLFLGLFSVRRDHIMLSLSFIIFEILARYIRNGGGIFMMLAISALSTLAVFVYEPSFFFIIPISVIVCWQGLGNLSVVQRIVKMVIMFSLPVCSMAIVCSYSGSQHIAESIWSSWTPLFEYLNIQQGEMPTAIQFLTYQSSDVMKMHLSMVYGIDLNDMVVDLKQFVAGLLFLFGFYYLTMMMPRQKYNPCEARKVSNVYLVQFFFLIPMFSVLSCDFGRTMSYLVLTSLYIVFVTTKYNIDLRIPFVEKVSDNTISLFERNLVLKSFWFYLFVVIFVPFGFTGAPALGQPYFKTHLRYIIDRIPDLLEMVNKFAL